MQDTTLNSEFGFYHKSESIQDEEYFFESNAYMDAFFKISQDTKVLEGDFEGVLLLVCQALQQSLAITRVSYWNYIHKKNEIHLAGVFPENETIPSIFKLNDFPIYGEALKEKGVIVAHQARRFHKTLEFRDIYLVPENIFSMLDTPVIYEGELLGVLCCEQKNEIRNWNTVELLLLSTLSGLLTITWQNKELRNKSDQIAEHLKELENFNLVVSSINKKLKIDNVSLINELAEQNKMLKNQNNKLREFAQMNSHELKAPDSNILGLIELRKNSDTAPENKQGPKIKD